jgi:hypothetical protein
MPNLKMPNLKFTDILNEENENFKEFAENYAYIQEDDNGNFKLNQIATVEDLQYIKKYNLGLVQFKKPWKYTSLEDVKEGDTVNEAIAQGFFDGRTGVLGDNVGNFVKRNGKFVQLNKNNKPSFYSILKGYFFPVKALDMPKSNIVFLSDDDIENNNYQYSRDDLVKINSQIGDLLCNAKSRKNFDENYELTKSAGGRALSIARKTNELTLGQVQRLFVLDAGLNELFYKAEKGMDKNAFFRHPATKFVLDVILLPLSLQPFVEIPTFSKGNLGSAFKALKFAASILCVVAAGLAGFAIGPLAIPLVVIGGLRIAKNMHALTSNLIDKHPRTSGMDAESINRNDLNSLSNDSKSDLLSVESFDGKNISDSVNKRANLTNLINTDKAPPCLFNQELQDKNNQTSILGKIITQFHKNGEQDLEKCDTMLVKNSKGETTLKIVFTDNDYTIYDQENKILNIEDNSHQIESKITNNDNTFYRLCGQDESTTVALNFGEPNLVGLQAM